MKERLDQLLRPVRRFFGRISKKKQTADKTEPKFCFMGRFWVYLLFIAFALVFTQALRSTVSSVLLIFLLLLPLTSLLYLLVGFFAVKVYLDSTSTVIEKMQSVDLSLVLANESPLPFPFVDALICVPGDSAVRCERELTRLSLIPFGRYVIRKTPTFAYRGGYNIGVSDIYIYDLFRLFRLRMDTSEFREIFVMPRRLLFAARTGSENSTDLTENVNRFAGTDNTETSEIRDYRYGDPLRSIHWKLSSKTEELQVRQYAKNSERQAIIFCDTARRYDNTDPRYSDDIGEFVADGVIETAIALALHTLDEQSGSVTLVWYDERSESGVFGMHIDSSINFDEIYHTFATAPLTDAVSPLGSLAALVAAGSDRVTLRFVTGCVDSTLAVSMASVMASGASAAELYTYLPIEKVAESARSDFFDSVSAAEFEIARHGVKLVDARVPSLLVQTGSSYITRNNTETEDIKA